MDFRDTSIRKLCDEKKIWYITKVLTTKETIGRHKPCQDVNIMNLDGIFIGLSTVLGMAVFFFIARSIARKYRLSDLYDDIEIENII